jgi:hypothetical protein
LRGALIGELDGLACVSLRYGLQLRGRLEPGFAASGDVVAVIRPEHLAPGPPAHNANALRGVVRDVVYRGSCPLRGDCLIMPEQA